MKTTLFTSALLLSSATAAPTPGLISSVLGALSAATVSQISSTTTALNELLSAVGVSLATNANSHGSVFQFTFPHVVPAASKVPHTITWPTSFVNWKTYKANGANMGNWLEIEQSLDTAWWAANVAPYPDEWTWCKNVGFSVCGPILEKKYSSFFTTADIDTMASAGINTLRIPTTYQAWINKPDSWLYHGSQQVYLRKITDYAISKYNMHVIVGLHSLPGGINSLQIGEAFGHDGWFQNATNLAYSFQAVDAIAAFIATSGHVSSFTVAPLNEASDNFAGFATAAGLTTAGTNWIVTYINGVRKRLNLVSSQIPIMLQDSFLGASYWSPLFDSSANMVIDTHIYYFAASGIYSQYVAPAICGQAATAAVGSNFPVFVGEWSLQTLYNNTYAGRKQIFQTQYYSWNKYLAGGSFWTYHMYGTDPVDGEGTQKDYWSLETAISLGFLKNITDSYC
ncbi:protein of unknown function [Taphrina deformans PYCC 5710]|uniref:glucan 1,3-beta-glucosidase n=1 Tax=Taphrina deformans (strain PYCC 5710 / ATCC 11124 / CBS 356.35 / IMI 108563 / JCM 9778 / NBRC 8474) TaxID=1097556 RepID=R4XD65_TAPDE|nr:protein of unknown function [Taphrina deformans PYCC 5710]|eukprot:CCG83821.1 protein of unknown function [Taphrina deformans PYCC 5710]